MRRDVSRVAARCPPPPDGRKAASSSPPRARGTNRILLALGGVALAVVLLGALEIGLRLLGTPPGPSTPYLPFLDDREGMRVVPVGGISRAVTLDPPRSGMFLAARPPGTFRIVVMGSSAAYGDHLTPFRALSYRLERLLERRAPGVHWEVINAASPGSASLFQAAAIAEIVSKCQPSLVIEMGGNNEFHLLRSYKTLHPEYDVGVEKARRLLWRLQAYRWMRRLVLGDGAAAARPPGQRPGVDYRRTTVLQAERAFMRDVYRANLEEMADTCRRGGAGLVLCTVPHRETWRLPDEFGHDSEGFHDSDIRSVLDEARSARAGGARDAVIKVLEDGVARVPSPFLQVELGLALADEGRTKEALPHLKAAIEADPRPMRAPPSFRDTVLEVSRTQGVACCDLVEGLRTASGRGLLDENLFMDHCHPTDEAHGLIASLLLEALDAQRLLPVPLRAGEPEPSRWSVDALRDVEEWRDSNAMTTALEGNVATRDLVPVVSACAAIDRVPAGEKQRAIEERVPVGSSEVRALLIAGHMLFVHDEFRGAARYYEAASVKGPVNALLLRSLGHALLFAGEPTRALDAYRRAVQADARVATGFVRRAMRVVEEGRAGR